MNYFEIYLVLSSHLCMKVILGSASEGRKRIFSKYFPGFQVLVPNLDEGRAINDLGVYKTNPIFVSMSLSYRKSETIVSTLDFKDPFLLFTFDTVVVFQGDMKLKPSSKEEARRWLFNYRNDFQEVITGYTIFSSEKNIFVTDYDKCIVYFKDVDDQTINDYIDSNPVELWSGGIAIEIAKSFFNIIEGNVESIIGVPVDKLMKDLSKLGYSMSDIISS
jgi:septum formation protein